MLIKYEMKKKYKWLILLAALILLFLSFLTAFRSKKYQSAADNRFIREANEQKREMNEEEFLACLDYVEEQEKDAFRLTGTERERYVYSQIYCEKYAELLSLKRVLEKGAATERIERRMAELKSFYHSDLQGTMEKIQGNLWVYLLFIALFFFASLYSEDKEYVSKLLASAPLFQANIEEVS